MTINRGHVIKGLNLLADKAQHGERQLLEDAITLLETVTIDTHTWRHGNFFDYCAVCWAERQGHDNPICPGAPPSDEEPAA